MLVTGRSENGGVYRSLLFDSNKSLVAKQIKQLVVAECGYLAIFNPTTYAT